MDSEPWWLKYRKKKLKPRYRLSIEMLIRKSLRETLKEYLNSSSIAGVRHVISHEEPIMARIFMFLLLCAFFSTVLYYLYHTWVLTLANPLVVSGESFTYPIKDIDFPAVALCNINRISRKALKKKALEMWSAINYGRWAPLNAGRLFWPIWKTTAWAVGGVCSAVVVLWLYSFYSVDWAKRNVTGIFGKYSW